MSRVTPPVTKFTHAVRSFSSSARLGTPSPALSSRYLSETKAECTKRQLSSAGSVTEPVERINAHEQTRTHATMHRPVPRTQSTSVIRPRPLMQGFRTSAPAPAALAIPSIDFTFLPSIPIPSLASIPFAIRVPLLPDNYTPDRSASTPHAPEVLDSAIPKPEIVVVAEHPEKVVSALTEVVNNSGLEVDVGTWIQATGFEKGEAKDDEASVLGQVLKGMVDDLFGAKAKVA